MDLLLAVVDVLWCLWDVLLIVAAVDVVFVGCLLIVAVVDVLWCLWDVC